MPDQPDFLTVKQVAQALSLSEDHVLKLLKAKKLPGRKVGGVWRVSRRQLVAFIEGENGDSDKAE